MPAAFSFIYPFANVQYRTPSQDFGPSSFAGEPPYPDNAQTELWKAHLGAQGGVEPAILNYHRGTDFPVPSGTPLLAAADGTVELAGNNAWGYGWGLMVAIQHTNGWATHYAHLQSIDPSCTVGATVKQGQVIGLSGSSGNSAGPHLHLGLNLFGCAPAPAGFSDAGWTNPVPELGDAAIANPVPFTSADGKTQMNPAIPGYITLAQAVYYARMAGLPEDQVATAVAICQAESSLRIGAVSAPAQDGSKGYGLWQIEWPTHSAYDPARLTTDPTYNAQAMAAISSGGTNWRPWTTYGYVGNPPQFVGWGKGSFTQYLPAAQTAEQTTPLAQFPQADPSQAPLPIISAPILPVEQITLTPVVIDKSLMTRKKGLLPTCGLQIGQVVLPVATCQFTEPQYRTAGSWKATLPVDVFDRVPNGTQALQALFARAKTQMTILMGYVTPDRNGLPNPRQARPVFVGLATIPEIDDQTGLVTLEGSDLSGIFSDQSSTAPVLKPYRNMSTDKAIKQIVHAHFTPGQGTITVDIDPTAGTVGGLFGQDAVTTRTAVRTEWDLILALAEGEGMVAYFQGTTLFVKYVPDTDTEKPLTLYHRNPAKPGPLGYPRFRPQPHIKRDYNVVVRSYDTRAGTVRSATAGNADSPNTITIYKSPNYSQGDLRKKANSVWAVYSGTEYQANLPLLEPLIVAPTQPLVIESSAPYALYGYVTGRAHPYYVVSATTTYDHTKEGIAMGLLCSNRPPGVATADTASSIAL